MSARADDRRSLEHQPVAYEYCDGPIALTAWYDADPLDACVDSAVSARPGVDDLPENTALAGGEAAVAS